MSNFSKLLTALAEGAESDRILAILITPTSIETQNQIIKEIDPIVLTNLTVWQKLFLSSVNSGQETWDEVMDPLNDAAIARDSDNTAALVIVFSPDVDTYKAIPSTITSRAIIVDGEALVTA